MGCPSWVSPPPFLLFPISQTHHPPTSQHYNKEAQKIRKKKKEGTSAWLVTMATVAGYSAVIIPAPHTCDYLKLSVECSPHCCPTRPCRTRQGRELRAPGPPPPPAWNCSAQAWAPLMRSSYPWERLMAFPCSLEGFPLSTHSQGQHTGLQAKEMGSSFHECREF